MRQRTPPNGRSATGPFVVSSSCGSEAFAQPSSDPCHVAARSCHQLPRSPRFEVFEMRRLRVDQAGPPPPRRPAPWPLPASRRAPAGGRYARDACRMRAARSAMPVSWLAPPVSTTRAARLGRERRRGETVAHHFQDFLDPRLDDAHQRRPRDELRRLALVISDRRHRDHVAFIRSTGQNTAINRFDSLSVRRCGC